FFPVELSLTVILGLILPSTGLYRRMRGAAMTAKVGAIFNGTTVAVGLLIVLTYLSRVYAESRGLYLIAWGLIIFLLVVWKIGLEALRGVMHRRGIGVDN